MPVPEITKEYMLDRLDVNSVSVLVKTFIVLEEGAEPQTVGSPIRTSYANNSSGRAEVIAELPENFAAGILAVWGETPTVPDPPAPINALQEGTGDVENA